MTKLRSILAYASISWGLGYAFDHAISFRPIGEMWDMVYYGSAATVDWILFYLCQIILVGRLCRDVEALCIASIIANAFGFSLYMAESPPDLYNTIIKGINYALAIRLLYAGGGDVFNNYHWSDMVRCNLARRLGNVEREAQG